MIALQLAVWRRIKDSLLEHTEEELLAATDWTSPLIKDYGQLLAKKTEILCIFLTTEP